MLARSIRAALALATALLAFAAAPALAADDPGAVYTQTNPSGANAVLVLQRAADGWLSAPVAYPTLGVGAGSGLGSQGAVALSDDGRVLLAVNAGSSSVTSFRVRPDGLELASVVPSGGPRPVSVTVHKGLAYVLNGGVPNSVSGFRVAPDGALSPLPGSTRPLSGADTGPAQVQLSPDGRSLVVTEKATSSIDVYAVGADGLASAPHVYASGGATPFGFDFDRLGRLFVSDAVGGAPLGSGASSYEVSGSSLATITGFAPTGQTAACWLVVSKDGRFAWTANAASASISRYGIGHDGSLALEGQSATGAGAVDLAIAGNGRILLSLANGSHEVRSFRISADGSLEPVAAAGGLPAGLAGLAAR